MCPDSVFNHLKSHIRAVHFIIQEIQNSSTKLIQKKFQYFLTYTLSCGSK